MKNGAVVMLVVALTGAIAFSAGTALTPTYKTANNTPVATTQCVDSDPPSTTDTITVEGVQYNFIKRNANVSDDKVRMEMDKVGTANGKDVYKSAPNYFGDSLEDLRYVFSGKKEKNMWIFDVYIKNGVTVPDFIRNCKKIGGETTIDYWQTTQFPPAAFNKTDVDGGTALPDPAYVHNGLKVGSSTVLNLPGVIQTGTIFVKAKNQNYRVYYHLSTAYIVDGNDAYEYLPTDKPVNFSSDSKDNLQLKWFFLVNTPVISWWTPVCKPAIYLYPEQKQNISVEVKTPGKFTLTIPEYPNGGWDVVADPDGTVYSGGKTYPYLYYESSIADDLITKPQEGYVASYTELPDLYTKVLPELGLSAKEAKEFKEYWEKALPYSPYYFVGVMSEQSINDLEPLVITPAPDSLVRVRLYFEPLKERKFAQQPQILTPERNGFVVSEWGGMVKLHEGSNFTCVQ